MSDVNHPSHYNQGGIEVAMAMDVLLGSTDQWAGHFLKYITRYPHKSLAGAATAYWFGSYTAIA